MLTQVYKRKLTLTNAGAAAAAALCAPTLAYVNIPTHVACLAPAAAAHRR